MKLIASDMDGTLLQHGAMQVSERAIELIQQLTQKGYLFVAASGRQYPNLKRQFKEAAKDMAFLCENGAVIFYQDKLLFHSPMDHSLALKLCEDIVTRPGCEVLISGIDVSYLIPKDLTFLNRMQNIVKNNVRIVKNFHEIQEPIVKISVFEESGIVENSGSYFISKWSPHTKCTISGFGWLDFVNPDVNKGTSLNHLMNTLSIKKEVSYAFGDNYNDIEMLHTVQYGYVMENAVKDIKEQFHYKAVLVEDELEKILEKENHKEHLIS